MNVEILKGLRDRLLGSNKKYLTVKDIREIMASGKPMPTAIFEAKRRDYIVPSRDIYERPHRRRIRDRIKDRIWK